MSTALEQRQELDAVLARFAGISDELLTSYDRLAKKAHRVEAELATANRRLEEQVAQLDRIGGLLEAVLESLPSGVVVRSSSGALERANAAALRLGALLRPRDPGQGCLELLELAPAADGWLRLEARGGDVRHIQRRKESIQAERAGCVGEVWVLDDITDRLRLETQVRQAEKMSALGTLSAGVAHEIRNPLNAVAGFASLLLAELPSGTRTHRWAQCISEGARRTDEVVSSLVSFARPRDLRLESVPLVSVIEDALSQEFEARADHRNWSVAIEGPDPCVLMDRIKLRQALRNLLANAMDCQPQGGPIRITIRSLDDECCLDVEDGGPGLPAERPERLMEPFYTTRADGCGLGLALVDTIARLHGGRLILDPRRSDLGGARLTLRLPRTTGVESPQ